MSGAAWSDWQEISPAWNPSPTVLAEILDGGQAFRWHHGTDGIWTGVWSDHVAQLRISDRHFEWRAPSPLQPRVAATLPRYLGLGLDWPTLADSLPWRSDAHLARCLAEFDFRYSNRANLGVDDALCAEKAILGMVGKRLTYRRTDQSQNA